MKTRSGIAPCLRPLSCKSGARSRSGLNQRVMGSCLFWKCRDSPHWCSDLDDLGAPRLWPARPIDAPEVFESVTFVTMCKACGAGRSFDL